MPSTIVVLSSFVMKLTVASDDTVASNGAAAAGVPSPAEIPACPRGPGFGYLGPACCAGAPLNAELRCGVHVDKPLPSDVSGVRLVLHDLHYRRDVRRGDARGDAGDAYAAVLRSVFGCGSGSRSRSTSWSDEDDDDDDLPDRMLGRVRDRHGRRDAGFELGLGGAGGKIAHGFGREVDDDVSMLSASETNCAALHYSESLSRVVDGAVDPHARGAVFVRHCKRGRQAPIVGWAAGWAEAQAVAAAVRQRPARRRCALSDAWFWARAARDRRLPARRGRGKMDDARCVAAT